MDYGNYSTTSYSAQGNASGGGFMPGSQQDSPSGKRSYGKDTLRPVTIKQLLDAHHPHPDAEYFMIDGSEATQVTFVGQIRNISTQTTNVTYKVDDGTGIIEVKIWIDGDRMQDGDGDVSGRDKGLVEQGYARVWGRLKAFNSKRHVGANIVRPITDMNEISYHLLEATVVHLHFTRGAPGEQANGGAQANGGQGQQNGVGGGDAGGNPALPAHMSSGARKVFNCIKTTQIDEGLHMQDIAVRTGMEVSDVMKAGEELQGNGLIYTTVDDLTWALLQC